MDDTLTLDVNGRDVAFDDPGKARAAARKWSRMAAEIDTPGATDTVKEKVRELRARAKAANDWARKTEDQAAHDDTITRLSPSSSARGTAKPAGGEPAIPSAPSRRQAAAALTATGVRKTRRSASTARRGVRRATRSYEAAGGAPVATSVGELAIFFFGSIVALTLLEDLLSKQGSGRFSVATGTVASLAHRLIAPVPLVGSNAAAPAPATTTKGG